MKSHPHSTRFSSCGACLLLLAPSFAHAQSAPPLPPASAAPAPTPPAALPAPAAPAQPPSPPSEPRAEPPAPAPLPSADDLATPDEVPESEVLVAPPSVVVETPPAKRRVLTIRDQRRLALTGELGWNGLAGFGAILTYHATPHVSFDLGAGLAIVGLKVGLRGRYNLLTSSVTPFLGAGFMAASGWDSTLDVTDPNTDDKLNVKVSPSAFFHSVAGIDWTSPRGFTLLGTLGYAWLMSGDNVEIVTGEPNADQRQGLDVSFHSGPVISLAIGYSFQ